MATHQTDLELREALPLELDAGAVINLKFKASCSEGCDVSRTPVQVCAGDGAVIAMSETGDLALNAPAQAGEHTWTILFRRQQTEGLIHEESSLVVSFTTIPHTTSVAVWDIPSPVVVNRSFNLKAGVKCSAACALAGQSIEVCDQAGDHVGEGRLGETTWPGTTALYVAEVELAAPGAEGMHSWSARFAATDSDSGLPHAETTATFSFRTARQPEYTVTVRVTARETQTPLENADVRLGVYRASTDSQGLARMELPSGVYELDVWKIGYETVPTIIDVTRDQSIQVEAASSPEKDPDDSRIWM
jgi:hypothetical protein